MFFPAMRCLQGRPMQAAATERLSLGVTGRQLTPGNAPTPDWLDGVKPEWECRG
ncbi:hypothetical protein [Acanthopleuribacter pedis]|uniref:Uncharacterized protein n=1 Tax=Acanthopleuribacter pedis TaxID=442870 RepID=A0A8J7Q6E5_9BACT|nr:hypothetical protein [Acanthopleuribacter pedis]MBO1317539.1 hypothetical protein [Acanthopleuribacter pedis]